MTLKIYKDEIGKAKLWIAMKGTYATKVKLVVVVKLFFRIFWRKGLVKEAKMFEITNLDSYFSSL